MQAPCNKWFFTWILAWHNALAAFSVVLALYEDAAPSSLHGRHHALQASPPGSGPRWEAGLWFSWPHWLLASSCTGGGASLRHSRQETLKWAPSQKSSWHPLTAAVAVAAEGRALCRPPSPKTKLSSSPIYSPTTAVALGVVWQRVHRLIRAVVVGQ